MISYGGDFRPGRFSKYLIENRERVISGSSLNLPMISKRSSCVLFATSAHLSTRIAKCSKLSCGASEINRGKHFNENY